MAHPVLGVVLRGFVTLYPDFLLRWVIYVGETPLVGGQCPLPILAFCTAKIFKFIPRRQRAAPKSRRGSPRCQRQGGAPLSRRGSPRGQNSLFVLRRYLNSSPDGKERSIIREKPHLWFFPLFSFGENSPFSGALNDKGNFVACGRRGGLLVLHLASFLRKRKFASEFTKNFPAMVCANKVLRG